MSVIFRSDKPNPGPAFLSSISAGVQAATRYQNRVLADGGEIVDPSYVSDTFAFMVGQSMATNEFVVGSKMGIKRAGITKPNADMVKLYSFDGNDMVFFNQTGVDVGVYPQYDTASYAFPVVNSTHSFKVLRNFRTQQLTRIQTGDGWGFAFVMRDDGDDAHAGTWQAYYPNGANIAPAGLIPLNGATFDGAAQKVWAYAPRVGYTIGANQSDTVACVRSTVTPYVAWDGIAMHARQSTGVLKVWQNNTLTDTQTDASGFKDMRSEQVYLAFGYKEFSGGLVRAFRQHQFAELWQVKDASEAQMQALSNRLGVNY